ncbi:hypothetical protein OSH05_19095 [Kaistia algarum]|nr:hypothetical protein [Kaistia algarum]
MSRLGAESWLAAGAVWLLIMLPSAAFGGNGPEATRSIAGGMASVVETSLGLAGF